MRRTKECACGFDVRRLSEPGSLMYHLGLRWGALVYAAGPRRGERKPHPERKPEWMRIGQMYRTRQEARNAAIAFCKKWWGEYCPMWYPGGTRSR